MKIGETVIVINKHLNSYRSIGILHGIDHTTAFPYRVRFEEGFSIFKFKELLVYSKLAEVLYL